MQGLDEIIDGAIRRQMMGLTLTSALKAIAECDAKLDRMEREIELRKFALEMRECDGF